MRLTECSFRAPSLTVLVGIAELRFFVHEPHIRVSSEYFQKAFSDDKKEITDYTVRLPEANPKAFDIYLKWLYSGRFYILAQDDVAAPDDKASTSLDGE